jgi:hypothetical protein
MATGQISEPATEQPNIRAEPSHPETTSSTPHLADLLQLDHMPFTRPTAQWAGGAENSLPMLFQSNASEHAPTTQNTYWPGSSATAVANPASATSFPSQPEMTRYPKLQAAAPTTNLSYPSEHQADPPPFRLSSNWISLDVGGTVFKMPRYVLEKSTVLNHALSQLSGKDGPFDFHADPDIFKHLLDYLRNDAFPLFWTKADGFDFVLYQRVQQDAELFHLWGLRDWIREQKYLQAVKIVYEESVETLEAGAKLSVLGNVDVERHVVTRMTPVFNCPRGIPVHRVIRGVPLVCGRECRKSLGSRTEAEFYEDVPFTEVITLKKTYVFDSAILMKGIGEQ